MQRVKSGVRSSILILSFLSASVIANDWSAKYEQPRCYSNDDPRGDVNLVCSESDTVKNLEVSIIKKSLRHESFSGEIKVTNTNDYPVLIQTILVDALDANGQVIGFCSNKTKQSIFPNDSVEATVGCQIHAVLPENENDIVSVRVRVTPWK